jgi:hypothetical protein
MVEEAGVNLSYNMKFAPSKYRRRYAPIGIEDQKFRNGKAHYTKWCAIGRQVSSQRCGEGHLLIFLVSINGLR